jgi:hypothetical protein
MSTVVIIQRIPGASANSEKGYGDNDGGYGDRYAMRKRGYKVSKQPRLFVLVDNDDNGDYNGDDDDDYDADE